VVKLIITVPASVYSVSKACLQQSKLMTASVCLSVCLYVVPFFLAHGVFCNITENNWTR